MSVPPTEATGGALGQPSSRTIVVALVANLGVAIAKVIAAAP